MPVYRHKQCARPGPCKWCCKADPHIADDSRKHRCRCNTENQFNDAGCKWRPAVSHTLDGRTVYLQHSKQQVKRRYGQQIMVRIPDDLCCRLTYKHRHYQVAFENDHHAHNGIGNACLKQACGCSFADAVP